MAEFTTPSFLENTSTDDLFNQMLEILPSDIDVSQGSHTWNFLRPTALVGAYLCEYMLPQVIQLIFPEWSYGEYLDMHAQVRGMSRKEATAATGSVTITGTPLTIIPAGTVFSTFSANTEDPSISYETLNQCTIQTNGSITTTVECEQTGTIGNTPANTVILVSSSISGITSVTNPEAITGGTDEETDESLIARIEEYDQNSDDSFVGNVADYKRWAMSVPGVGDASVVPADDDTGMVTIILTDSTGAPATEQLCTQVYNYIMSPDDPEARLAPINAYLTVESPTTTDIGVKATVELEEGATIDGVTEAFIMLLTAYLPEALSDDEIKITKVAAALSNTEGVNDFSNLQIGLKSSGGTITYQTTNITLTETMLPTVSAADVTLTSGTV